MAAGCELSSVHFKDRVNNTWAFGIMPFAKWYINRDESFRLFFQYGAGVSYSTNKFPLTGTGLEADTARVGTKFNFNSKYGIGAEFHPTKQLWLQAGIKHFHLSNGNIKGIQRNPSHDSNGFFAGVIYKINKQNHKQGH